MQPSDVPTDREIWTCAALAVVIGLFIGTGCSDGDTAAGPDQVELRLTSCAPFADEQFSEDGYEFWHQAPSGLPCSDGLLGCPHNDQNERYAALADTAYALGWNQGALLEYQRCLERIE